MNKIIEVSNITYTVKSKTILNNISFSVQENEIFVLLGENGSGKSTLLNLILNDLKLRTGYIRIFEMKRTNFKNVGVLYDHLPLFPLLRVSEIISYFATIHKLNYKTIRNQYFDNFEINEISKSFIRELSQGELKRVGLFLSIMHDPDLLILDEPFANLDPTIIDKIWGILTKNNRTVLMTTNNWGAIEKMATKVTFILNGELTFSPKAPQEIINELPSDKKIIISNKENIIDKLNDLDFYSYNNELHVFFDKKSNTMNTIQKLTNNFTVQNVGLQDAYLFRKINLKKKNI